MPTLIVSSAELLKAYGRIAEAALREPVSITHHGRERLVLMSTSEYQRLKRNDRVALSVWELSEEDIGALRTSAAPPETAQFNDEYQPD